MARTKAPVAGETPAAGGPALADGSETAHTLPFDVVAAEDAIVALEDVGVAADQVTALDASDLAPAAVAALKAELPDLPVVGPGERLVYALVTIVDATTTHDAGSYLALDADEAARLIRIGAALDPDAPALRRGDDA